MVLRKNDGLAVQREATPSQKRPARRLPKAVSRHCQHVPTQRDIEGLSLGISGFGMQSGVASVSARPPTKAMGAGEVEALMDLYGEEGRRFIQWYHREEGKYPAPELLDKVMDQINRKNEANASAATVPVP